MWLARTVVVAAPFAAALPGAAAGQAVTDDWASAKVPLDAPPVKAVTVDPRTTALALLDFNTGTCSMARRPRCVADLPKIAALLAAARAHGMFVFETLAGTTTPAQISPELAPRPGEPVLPRSQGPDKYIGAQTDLQKLLADKGITTIVVCGTGANGAALYMASASATRGFKVIVAVDGIPGDSATIEAFAVWELAHAPTISDNVTLTKTDLISFAQ
jgi:nicotinamidase-related amidase